MPRSASENAGQRVGVADVEHHFVLMDGLVDAGEAVERNHGVVAIGGRPRFDVDELGLLLANLLQTACATSSSVTSGSL